MAEWYDSILDTVKAEGTQLAKDWITNTANLNRPTIGSSPQPIATLPAVQVQAQNANSKYLIYGAIAIAIIGVFYLFKPSKGKK